MGRRDAEKEQAYLHKIVVLDRVLVYPVLDKLFISHQPINRLCINEGLSDVQENGFI